MPNILIILSSFGLAAICFVIFINMMDGMSFHKLVYVVARTIFIVSVAVIGLASIAFAIRVIVNGGIK